MAKTLTNYKYDTLGNLILETSKNAVIDYQYNNLNQLVRRAMKNDVDPFTYAPELSAASGGYRAAEAEPNKEQTNRRKRGEVCDYVWVRLKRGNRVAENGKKGSQKFVYDATNHLVEGTNWRGDKSAYTYNGLFVRVNNTQTTHAGQVYDRDFVIDYNSFERNDLMVFSPDYYQQKHAYTAWGERMEMFTDRTAQSGGNGGLIRLLYVHEDIMACRKSLKNGLQNMDLISMTHNSMHGWMLQKATPIPNHQSWSRAYNDEWKRFIAGNEYATK